MGQYKRPVVFDPRTNKFFIDEVIGNVRLINPGVTSIEGEDGDVTLEDINLGNVDNTSDADKPVSTAQQAALDAKANAIEWTITSNGSSDYIFSGAGFAGTETDPVLYVVRGQTYKFTNEMGAHPFRIQSTQGTGGSAYDDGVTNNEVTNGTLTWEVRMDAPSTLYYQCTSHAAMNGTIYVLDEGSAVSSIDALSDVDTSTVAPTDGQALVWDNTAQKWEPGTVSSAGAVTSVNTQTGAVSLGVEDLDDFGLNDAGGTSSVTRTPDTLVWNIGSSGVGYGELQYGVTYWSYGSEGYNGSNILTYLRDTATFPIDVEINGVTVAITNATVYPTNNTNNIRLHHSNFSNTNNIPANVDWVLSLPNTPSEPLANGDILQYVSAESKFKPAQLGVDDLSDVDTSTVAPTDGQALVWDNTAQKWEPGTISGGVTSVNTQTGAVSLGVDDLSDVDTSTVAPTDGQALVWDNTASKWEPGGVTSVNTQTGAVSLGVENLNDVQYNVTTTATVYEFTYGGTSGSAPAGYAKVILNPNTNPPSTDKLRLSRTDANGTSVPAFANGSTVWLSADEVTYVTVTPTSFGLSADNWVLSLDSADEDTYDTLGIAVGGTLYASATDPAPQTVNPSNGEILQYETASSKFKPASAVNSINSLTGAVSLGVEELNDFALNQTYNLNYSGFSTFNTPSAGEWHINASFFYLPKIDVNGTDHSSNFRALDGTTSLTITQGGTDYVITNATLFGDQLDDTHQRALITSGSSSGGLIATIDGQITKSGTISIASPSFSGSPVALADGDILQYNSTDSKFKPAQLGVDDLNDVDTSTVAPTDGQALVWDNTASKWEPGTISGGVTSVNTQTGAVSLGVEDLDDFALNQSSNQTSAQWSTVDSNQNFTNDGEWYPRSTTQLVVADTDDNGTNQVSFLSGLSTMWVSQDGTNFTQLTVSSVSDWYTTATSIVFTTAHGITSSGYVIIADQDLGLQDVPLAEGDILQYVSADSKFKPAQLGVDDLSDVDTTTVAPTDGQALVWDNANSQWEPGTISSGATLPSANDGEALIYENGQWVAGPVIGGVDYTPSSATTNSTPPTGFSVWVDTWNTGVSGITYSNSDRTATYSSADVSAYSATGKSTGKWYTELSLVGVDADMIVGFATSNTATHAGLSGTGGFGIRQGGSSFNDAGVTIDAGYSNAWGYSNYVMFAIDFDAKLIWFGVNGTWQNSGDPAAGTGYVFSAWTGTPTWYLGFRLLSSGDSGTWEPYNASNITIPYSIDKLEDVDTSTVAPTDGQALVWDNTAQKWEPGSSGTTLPSAQDGEALIYENGQWITGPVIGGVNYTSGVTSVYTVPTGFSSWSDTWTFGSSVTNITLSNSDRTATATSFDIYPAYSASSKSTGKWYWEIRVGGTTDYAVGLIVNPNQFPGAGGTGGIGFSANGTIHNDAGATVATFSGFSANDVLMFALDAAAKKLWIGVNGTWDNSGDPAAGTGAIAYSWTATPDWLFAARMFASGMTATIENYGGTQVTIPYSIDKLDDVDTSTVAPTDGQALIWDNTASKWEPGTISAGVTSVNTQTGAVSLGVEDLDDFLLQSTPPVAAYHDQKQTNGNWPAVEAATGGWAWNGPTGNLYSAIYINQSPTSGTSLASQGFSSSTLDLYVSTDGTNFTQHTATSNYSNSSRIDFAGLSPDLSAYSSATTLYFRLTSGSGTPIALADGDILQYEANSSKFRPAQLPAGGMSRAQATAITLLFS